MRCPTCHNASFAWKNCVSSNIDHLEVLKRVQKNKKWLDGLVLTGGEVTIIPGFEDLLRILSSIGLPMKIDTNGQRPDAVELALRQSMVKTIAVDVKGPWNKYPHLCGGLVSSSEARYRADEIFGLAQGCPERFMFRCTRVPGLTSDDIQEVRSYLPGGFDLHIQKYQECLENGLS